MALGDPLVQVPAIVSSVGAFFVVCSWLLCRRWRAKVEAGKLILLVIGCTDFIAAANYFNAAAKNNHAQCIAQALVMQGFEISSWNYNAVLAYEVYFLVTSSTTVLIRDKNRMRRHGIYHLIVVGFAIATVATALAEGVMGIAGNWCWLTDSTYRIGFGYVPLWIGFAIIITCNSMVLRMVIASDSQKQERGRTKSSDKRHRLLFRAGVMKLLIVPFAFILLHLPGTFRRIMEAAAYDGHWYDWIGSLQSVCDPSQGTLTALLYLGLDADLRKEWWFVLQGRALEFQGDSSTFSSSHVNSNISTVGALPNEPNQDIGRPERQSTSIEHEQRNSVESRLSSFVGSIFRNSRFGQDSRGDSIASPPRGASNRFNEYVDAEYVDEEDL